MKKTYPLTQWLKQSTILLLALLLFTQCKEDSPSYAWTEEDISISFENYNDSIRIYDSININVDIKGPADEISYYRLTVEDSIYLDEYPGTLSLNVAFAESGKYQIELLTVVGGTRYIINKEWQVYGELPHGIFTRNDSVYSAGPITFTNQLTSLYADAEAWHWDFGKGLSSTETSPSFSFDSCGKYPLTLTCTLADKEVKIAEDVFIYSSVSDVDGNIYPTLKYGSQEWMVSNFKCTHYPDGTEIPKFEYALTTSQLYDDFEAYCYYQNNDDNKDIFGGLYTFAAAQKACPSGWHLPTFEEWLELLYYLGFPEEEFIDEDMINAPDIVATILAKGRWTNLNVSPTNSAGLSYVGSGSYMVSSIDLYFKGLYYQVELWATSDVDTDRAYRLYISYYDSNYGTMGYYPESHSYYGYGVRYIKD